MPWRFHYKNSIGIGVSGGWNEKRTIWDGGNGWENGRRSREVPKISLKCLSLIQGESHVLEPVTHSLAAAHTQTPPRREKLRPQRTSLFREGIWCWKTVCFTKILSNANTTNIQRRHLLELNEWKEQEYYTKIVVLPNLVCIIILLINKMINMPWETHLNHNYV